MEESKKKNTGLVVTIIILVICVLGLGGYLAYDKLLSKDDKKCSEPVCEKCPEVNNNEEEEEDERKLIIEDAEDGIYYTKDKKHCVEISNGKILYDGEEFDEIYSYTQIDGKDNKYIEIFADDGRQSGFNIIIEDGRIISVPGYNEAGIKYDTDMDVLRILVTSAGDFLVLHSAYVGDEIYTKNGKYLGSYGYERDQLIADNEGIYLYPNTPDFYDDEELEQIIMTKYDAKGNKLGEYKCVDKKCTLVK